MVDGFWTFLKKILNDFTLKKQLFKFTVFYRSRRHSKSSWYSFDLQVFEGFGSNKFGIMIMTLKEISFKCESLTHSCKSLIISSIYLLPHAADNKRKRSLCQKNDLIVYGIYSARANNFVTSYIILSCSQYHFLLKDGWLVDNLRLTLVKVFVSLFASIYMALQTSIQL